MPVLATHCQGLLVCAREARPHLEDDTVVVFFFTNPTSYILIVPTYIPTHTGLSGLTALSAAFSQPGAESGTAWCIAPEACAVRFQHLVMLLCGGLANLSKRRSRHPRPRTIRDQTRSILFFRKRRPCRQTNRHAAASQLECWTPKTIYRRHSSIRRTEYWTIGLASWPARLLKHLHAGQVQYVGEPTPRQTLCSWLQAVSRHGRPHRVRS